MGPDPAMVTTLNTNQSFRSQKISIRNGSQLTCDPSGLDLTCLLLISSFQIPSGPSTAGRRVVTARGLFSVILTRIFVCPGRVIIHRASRPFIERSGARQASQTSTGHEFHSAAGTFVLVAEA